MSPQRDLAVCSVQMGSSGSSRKDGAEVTPCPANPRSTAPHCSSERDPGQSLAERVQIPCLDPSSLSRAPAGLPETHSCQACARALRGPARPRAWPAAPAGRSRLAFGPRTAGSTRQSSLGRVWLPRSVLTAFKHVARGGAAVSPRKDVRTSARRDVPPSCSCCRCANGAENDGSSFMAQRPAPWSPREEHPLFLQMSCRRGLGYCLPKWSFFPPANPSSFCDGKTQNHPLLPSRGETSCCAPLFRLCPSLRLRMSGRRTPCAHLRVTQLAILVHLEAGTSNLRPGRAFNAGPHGF